MQGPSSGSPGEVVSGASAAVAALAGNTLSAPLQVDTSAAKAGQVAPSNSGVPAGSPTGPTMDSSTPSGVANSQEKSEARSPQASGIPKEALAALFAPKPNSAPAITPPPTPKSAKVSAAVEPGGGDSRSKSEQVEPTAERSNGPQNKETAPASEPKSVPSAIDKTAIQSSDWPQLVSELDIAGMPLQLANHCVWLDMKSGLINLSIEADHGHLCEERFSSRLAQALGAWLGEDVKLVINSVTGTLLTPAVIAKNKTDDELAAAHESINLDPIVQQLVERVDGSVDQSSIRPVSQSPDES